MESLSDPKPKSDQYYINKGKEVLFGLKAFNVPDKVWTYEENGASIYVGDIGCACSEKNLSDANITRIINC